MSSVRTHYLPLLGGTYLVVIVLLIWSSIAIFNKSMPWQSAATVTLRTTTPGLELNPLSDVKFQGVRVGEVRRVTSDGRSAVIELALDNERLELIPANVDAAIIPKTLFGEKFVDLRTPAQPSAARMVSGGEIRQSSTSVELGTIFSKLVPILRTLKPEQLSVTLNSLADALDGRGATIARDLNQLDQLLTEIEPHLDTLTHDVDQFAKTSDIYASAASDLVKILNSTSGFSDDVLVDKEESFEQFLDQATDTSGDAAKVLRQNRDNLVTLTAKSRPVLRLLDDYSPMLPCFLKGLHTTDIVGNQAVGARGPFVNLIVDVVGVHKPYVNPVDLPSQDNDANNRNLPRGIPGWAPHCPNFPARVLALKDAPSYSLPLMPGVVLAPNSQRAAAALAPADTGTRSQESEAAGGLIQQKSPEQLGPMLSDLLIQPLLPEVTIP